MISACAAFSLHFHPFALPPFLPPRGNATPLLSAIPLRYHPLLASTPFVALLTSFRPLPSIVFPVVSRLSPRLSVPRLRFPFSSPDFPSLSPRRTRIFSPASLLPSSSGSVHRFLPPPLLSLACRSVSPPFDTRRSLFARVTHRRGETIRRFPGWHLVSRAAFFPLYLPVSFPCLLSS